jgi:dTMP kinase
LLFRSASYISTLEDIGWMAGLFIAVEGIDGCGKSTFAKGLADLFRKSGRKVVLTAEPTDTWLGDAVRKSWAQESGPVIEAYLFIADRVAHCASMERELAKGAIIISDRYHDSTLAYQGAALAERSGGLREALAWLRSITPPGLLAPDITFYLDIDPKTAMERMSGRPSLSKFETLALLEGVRNAYAELGKDGRFATLDATKPPKKLVTEALSELRRRAPSGIF